MDVNPIGDYLAQVLAEEGADTSGAVATYIPELANVDPERFGIAVSAVGGAGRTYAAGDDDVEFTIQSISKPFAYAVALQELGFDALDRIVSVEPSGEAFDELSLEAGTHRPKNAMINAGAIAVHALVAGQGATGADRVATLRNYLSRLAGRPLTVDQAVYRSEVETAHRNYAIAHMLRRVDIITADPHDIVDGYTQQCAIRVTARDLAVMGSTLANGGTHPITGERIFDAAVVRHVLSVMTGSGMYDAAGDWLTHVGIPAKSGVSGGVLGVLPGQVGIGVFSPRLDSRGNSVRGIAVCRRLSVDMGLHVLSFESVTTTALRGVERRAGELVYRLQGTIEFTGAEALLDDLARRSEPGDRVVLDLTNVHHFTDVGQRMVLEVLRRVRRAGGTPAIIDPAGVLPDPDLGDVGDARAEQR